MPDQSQCPISPHSPFLLRTLQYTLLKVCLPFSQTLYYSLDSYMIKFYCNKSQQWFSPSPPSCIIACPDTPCLMRPLYVSLWSFPCGSPEPSQKTFIVQQLPAGGVLPYLCFHGSLGEMRGLDNAVGYELVPMSAGRQGAAQDKLWQLDQKLRGLCAGQPPSVVQWYSLFKSTPAAVKCNITPPSSQAVSAEPQRLNGKSGFKS